MKAFLFAFLFVLGCSKQRAFDPPAEAGPPVKQVPDVTTNPQRLGGTWAAASLFDRATARPVLTVDIAVDANGARAEEVEVELVSYDRALPEVERPSGALPVASLHPPAGTAHAVFTFDNREHLPITEARVKYRGASERFEL